MLIFIPLLVAKRNTFSKIMILSSVLASKLKAFWLSQLKYSKDRISQGQPRNK